jgi:hypothetical protein
MVAWHEVPGIVRNKRPVPEGQDDCVCAPQRRADIDWHVTSTISVNRTAGSKSYRPSGTDRFFPTIPGTSCQAHHLVPPGHR